MISILSNRVATVFVTIVDFIMGLLTPKGLMMLMRPTSRLAGVCLTPWSAELATVVRMSGTPQLLRYWENIRDIYLSDSDSTRAQMTHSRWLRIDHWWSDNVLYLQLGASADSR